MVDIKSGKREHSLDNTMVVIAGVVLFSFIGKITLTLFQKILLFYNKINFES